MIKIDHVVECDSNGGGLKAAGLCRQDELPGEFTQIVHAGLTALSQGKVEGLENWK